MHVLTKAFVVLAAVLSIALSGLVIAYAVNTDRIASDYRGMKARSDTAELRTAEANRMADEIRVRLTADKQQLSNDFNNAVDELRKSQAAIAKLQGDLARAEAARQQIESKIAEYVETAKLNATLISTLHTENSTLHTNELSFRNRALEMDNRMAELESQKEVLDQRYRAIMEQFTDLKRQNDVTLAGGSAAGGENQPFVFSGGVINGRVDEVANDPATSRQLARISVGSNDRVQKNMKFLVVRDGKFLTNLVVVQTDLQWSLAAVQELNNNASVQVGDLVMSRAD